MDEAWPLVINATRMYFQAARDRSHFLLTVESRSNPSVDIRLPIEFASELESQLRNLLARAGGEPLAGPGDGESRH